jgi:23S rRNA pseudouridine2605 synthase
MTQRIQKILSQWGIASRRQAEQMILEGRVTLNGNKVHLGDKADVSVDRLEVDGVEVKLSDRPQLVYILLNKPIGFVCTRSDPQNRPTVLDLLPVKLKDGRGIHPVGRLDIESTGALLLTNDGDLTLKLTHPRYHLPKTYRVWLNGHPSESILNNWRQGVVLLGKKTLPAKVEVIQRSQQETLVEIVLREGRNRQIRRVAEQLGFQVTQLHRVAIGSIQLQSSLHQKLPMGRYRLLTDPEILYLKDYQNQSNQNLDNLAAPI